MLVLHARCWSQDQADVVAIAEKSVLKIVIEDSGLGSGFVLDADGIAATNLHVIAGAKNGTATATFCNGEACSITGIYWVDEGRDIAIIQLDRKSLTPLPIATELPRKGDEVLALGSPMGLSFAATRGIISAVRNEEEMKKELNDDQLRGTWLQVDVPLSPGNSGGPLINRKGEMVGMSTKASFGRAQNINFGISAKDVRDAYELAQGRSLKSLDDAVGRMAVAAAKDAGEKLPQLKRTEIPSEAIRQYCEQINRDYTLLTKAIRREIVIQKEYAKNIKNERSFIFSPSERNEALKKKELLIRDLEEFNQNLSRTPDDDSVLALAAKYGSPVDIRKKGSVGFLQGAELRFSPFGSNFCFATIGEPGRFSASGICLLWVENPPAFGDFDHFFSGPVYVVGTSNLEEGTPPMTILISVLESELKEAMNGSKSTDGDSASASENSKTAVATSLRTWKDRSGKYQIEARLLEFDGTKVVLKKEDGTEVTVPFAKLSDADRNYLKSK